MAHDLKVLIVDDSEANVAGLKSMLEQPGTTLLHTLSGAAAVELLLEHEVAVVLIDAGMPGMDGYQLAELLHASPRTQDIPILFMLDANDDPQPVYETRHGGAVDFMRRPLAPKVVRGKVDTFIKLHTRQQQLTRQLETLEQSLRLNEMFAAVLGHDLRSPLSAIMVGAELVIVRNKDEGDVSAALRIRDSAKRMSHLISQLIDMARVRSGHASLLLQECDFAAICRDVVGEIESTQQRRVSVECKGDTRGVWDPHRLSQILSNLAGNAVKHGDPTQPVVIRIDGSQGERVQCSVHNGGVIAAQLLPHIFKPFRGYEDGNGRERRAGLGLGLYIVQQLVTMHGGEIGVRSEAPAGTAFSVSLLRRTGPVHTPSPARTPA